MAIPHAGSTDWMEDCMRWRRRVLTGKYRHWCYAWDELPIDETCHEWPCECAAELIEHFKNAARLRPHG
jgi:hypothetical protein